MIRRFHDPELGRLAALAEKLGAEMRSSGATMQAPAPGAYFDVPGIPGGSTQWTEQYESTTGLVTTLSSASQVAVTGIQNFRQTDVVTDWLWDAELSALSFTAGTGQTLTSSNYAPANFIGPVQLLIQNQYASVDVESGIDLLIFNLIRPYRKSSRYNVLYANVQGDRIGDASNGLGYLAAANAQPLLINTAQWSRSSTTFNLLLRIPASQWFDEYFDLAVTGEPIQGPLETVVSPQYMAGTTRVIAPVIRMNALLGSTNDIAPVSTTSLVASGDTASTASGTLTSNFRRKAIYASNPSVLPPVYSWQYRWKTTRFSLSGVQRLDLLLPLDTGQLMSVYVRMFDPTANAPISLATVTRANLQYGSGLFWFDDLNSAGGCYETQRNFIDQHGFVLPPGVIAWDLALDEKDNITNRRCLNTLTTAGILVHLEFTAALSSTAYAVLGTESLVYVS